MDELNILEKLTFLSVTCSGGLVIQCVVPEKKAQVLLLHLPSTERLVFFLPSK